MCVWSAYAGHSPAAPKLWDSLGRIEGIWAGFYTGMVTVDNGQLYWKKCAGHMEIWKERFALEALKGCTGLIHSRTDSGGDDRRAHPYVGASAAVALVSQGCTGVFSGYTPLVQKLGNEMLSRGRICRSAAADDSRCPVLQDGRKVSMSDVVVNMAEEEYLRSRDPLKAMQSICGILPEESATVFVFADRPGYLGFVNANQHLVCDFESNGVYLSVSTLGVPGYAMEIPGNSLGYVTTKGEFFRTELSGLYRKIDTWIPEGLLPAMADAIREDPGKLLGNYCDSVIVPLLSRDRLTYRAALAWRALEVLCRADHIRFEPAVRNGSSGVPGKYWKIHWKDFC